MTKIEANNLIANEHLIHHFASGGTIQSNYQLMPVESFWNDDTSPDFTHDPRHLRIGPRPMLRKWTMEEVPVGAVLRWPAFGTCIRLPLLITEVDVYGNVHYGSGYVTSCESLITRGAEYSTDHCKTWQPCGVRE